MKCPSSKKKNSGPESTWLTIAARDVISETDFSHEIPELSWEFINRRMELEEKLTRISEPLINNALLVTFV